MTNHKGKGMIFGDKAPGSIKTAVLLLCVGFLAACGGSKLKAVEDSATVVSGQSVIVDMLKNDRGTNTLSRINIIQKPTGGIAELLDNGTPNDFSDDQIRYTANRDFNGQDQIIYELRDGKGEKASAVITILVEAASSLSVEVVFPPEYSNLNGAKQVTVRGNVIDTEGTLEDGEVKSLSVNGVLAEFDPVDSSQWIATVPIKEGRDNIFVELESERGQKHSQTVEIFNQATFGESSIATMDRANNMVFITDRRRDEIYSIDPINGSRELISGPAKGDGPRLNISKLEFNEINNTLLTINYGLDIPIQVIEVDIGSGNRKVILDLFPDDWDVVFREIAGLSIDPGQNRIIISHGFNSLISVDLENGDISTMLVSMPVLLGGAWIKQFSYHGDREQVIWAQNRGLYAVGQDGNAKKVSGSDVGIGTDFIKPVFVVVEPKYGNAIVYDLGKNALIRVDLSNGDRGILRQFDSPIAFETLLAGSENIYVGTARSDLLEIEQQNGKSRVVSEVSRYVAMPDRVKNIAPYDQDNFVFTEGNQEKIYKYNYDSKEYSIIYEGPQFQYIGQPSLMSVDAESDSIFLFDPSRPVIKFIDLKTAGSRDLDLERNSGEALKDMAFDPHENKFVFLKNFGGYRIETYDIATENTSIVTGLSTVITQPTSIVLDSIANRILIADSILDDVVAVDLVSRGRALLAQNEGADGVNLVDPVDMAVDEILGRALVLNKPLGIVSMDLASGKLQELSTNELGDGPGFIEPELIALLPGTNKAWVFDSGLESLLEVDLESGNRRILSSESVGRGPDLIGIRAMTLLEPNKIILASETQQQVISVDISTGDRLVLLGSQRGNIANLVADSETGRLICLSDYARFPSVSDIDVFSGLRSEIYYPDFSGNYSFLFTVDIKENRILLPNTQNGIMYEGGLVGSAAGLLDSSGTYTELRSASVLLDSSGAPIELGARAMDIEFDSVRKKALIYLSHHDEGIQKLVSIDINTGEQRVVFTGNISTDSNTGEKRAVLSEGDLELVFVSMIYDASKNRVLILNLNGGGVLIVDVESGQKMQIPFGPVNADSSMVLDEAKQLLYVESNDMVYALDLKTEEQTLLLY